MSLVEFPYTLHKGYVMPIIPIDSCPQNLGLCRFWSCSFSSSAAEATDMDIDWSVGRRQMVVVGDGSFIPVYLHNLSFELGDGQIRAPIGFRACPH